TATMKIYDLTRRVSPSIAVWPGDPPFERGWGSRLSDGDPANVGWIKTGLHVGTHADAPFHFVPDGSTIDDIPLEVFVGAALLVDAGSADPLGPELLPSGPVPPRILFRTPQSLRSDDRWDPSFAPVRPELAGVLGARGIVLL